MAVISVLARFHLKRSYRTPQMPDSQLVFKVTLGYIGWAWPLGMFAAWLNPGAADGWTWDYSCPNLLLLTYFCFFTLAAYDAYSYFLHRWMHANKTAFVWLHAMHHEHPAALDARTSGYMSLYEGLFSDALPLLAIYAAGAATGNWWYSYGGVWHAFYIVMVGHCGHDVALNSMRNMLVLLFNPMSFAFITTPVYAEPKEHEDHHAYPRRNYAYFLTYWDTRYKTDHKQRPHCTLVVLAAHMVYQFAFLASLWAALQHTMAYTTIFLVLYCVVTPRAAVALSEALRIPELTRRAFGWFMDLYRRDNFITYTVHDAFAAAAAAAAADACCPAAGAVDVVDDSSDDTVAPRDQDKARTPQHSQQTPPGPCKPPVYVFACHPTGLISRGAFSTFAARGWSSPVSFLPKVRMAVGSNLMRWPVLGMREGLLALGCIPAERPLMKTALLSGTSIAVTPGGWRESKHVQTYNLVLNKRKGFVALAAETGARLVPVLCLGEQDVVGGKDLRYTIVKMLLNNRVHPVHVVLGQPLVPGKDESVDELHQRYVAALLELGKQHGVQLTIKE